ncbi:SIR2-domain-containing protein [Auriscalpium vulgare]|uniref:SIR2-domain-containing protein n=1 Tax=Auriscalpium vulgare TaxID=40419 RepID=A0ACB8RX56_9AGAM|nr:SIR2-domain-containing protein [Auriscalpium vulgare]
MGKDDDGADDVDEDEDEDEDEENGSGFDGRSDFPYFDYTDPSRWWSFEVVNNMKTYLRRHGMKSFMVRYAANLNPPVNMIHLFGIDLCDPLRQKKPKTIIYFLKVAMTRELHNRVKLKEYNTIEDATYLIGTHRRILILTGAGISVSCGIPDFRSQNGLYASLKNEGQYELDDPQQMFDINYFKENPAVFYSFARQIYPSNFTPSPCHRFIKLVEDNGTLLRNYTQNIDTLETLAGVKNVLNCHGSFATASCLACNTRVPGTDIEDEILAGDVPLCKICSAAPAKKVARKRGKRGKKRDSDDDDDEPPYPPWVMKPDITFFGEKLSVDFEKALKEDRSEVDLIIIIGTSMKVAPVSEFLVNMPHHVPQILINKTPIRHINPDIILLGDADAIVEHLCASLSPVLPDWVLPSASTQSLQAPPHSKKRRSTEPAHSEPRRVGNRYSASRRC